MVIMSSCSSSIVADNVLVISDSYGTSDSFALSLLELMLATEIERMSCFTVVNTGGQLKVKA